MIPTCDTCHRPLTEVLSANRCERADCWLDFTPVRKYVEHVARPSPDYVKEKK